MCLNDHHCHVGTHQPPPSGQRYCSRVCTAARCARARERDSVCAERGETVQGSPRTESLQLVLLDELLQNRHALPMPLGHLGSRDQRRANLGETSELGGALRACLAIPRRGERCLLGVAILAARCIARLRALFFHILAHILEVAEPGTPRFGKEFAPRYQSDFEKRNIHAMQECQWSARSRCKRTRHTSNPWFFACTAHPCSQSRH